MLVLNTKQELLDWAVENIEGWDENYTDLRCDGTINPLFFSKREDWSTGYNNRWYNDRTFGNWDKVDFLVKASTPLVISKQEYTEVKNMKGNEFKLSDLKTGMRVTTRNGEVYVVFRDTPDGDVLCEFDGGFNWLDDYNENLVMKGKDLSEYDIIKVQNTSVHNLALQEASGTVIWERKEETEAQKKLRELKVKQEELVKSQQEVAKMISELEGNVK